MPYDFSEEASMTDSELSGAMAKLAPLSREDLVQLLPTEISSEDLDDLIGVINGATNQNQKIADLRGQAAKLGTAAIKLAKLVV